MDSLAHSLDNLSINNTSSIPILSPSNVTYSNYKIYRCPEGQNCSKPERECPYFHGLQDFRRKDIRYSLYKCKNESCTDSVCKYYHNKYEFDFHPNRYKTDTCGFYERNGYCLLMMCPKQHIPSSRIWEAHDLLVEFNKLEIRKLIDLLDPVKRDEISHAVSFYRAPRQIPHGWIEKDFEVGDKKKLKEQLSKVKKLMARSESTSSLAPKLLNAAAKGGSLKGMMDCVRVIAEEIEGTMAQRDSAMKKTLREIKQHTNWAHHSADGEPKYEITPSNQKEAIEKLEEVIVNVQRQCVKVHTESNKENIPINKN